jgi:hypothetical protein
MLLTQPALAASTTERDLGRRFYLDALAIFPLITDHGRNAYVNGLGKRLVAGWGTGVRLPSSRSRPSVVERLRRPGG